MATRNPLTVSAASIPDASQDCLYDEDRAAGLLAVSPRTLQKWRFTGGGPRFVRLSSRCIRYRHSELVNWTQHLTRSSTSDGGP